MNDIAWLLVAAGAAFALSIISLLNLRSLYRASRELRQGDRRKP